MPSPNRPPLPVHAAPGRHPKRRGAPPAGGFLSCDPTTGTPIQVGLGATTAGIDFELPRLGTITGTVTDAATGLPIGLIEVEVGDDNGSLIGSVPTDDSGTYTLGGVLPGIYFGARGGGGIASGPGRSRIAVSRE